MPYLGNTPTTQSFISGTDYFNGTGSQTAFTLSRTVASINDIQVTVNNVVQQPNDAYTISGTTLTMTSAPSVGTNNVYVRYLSTTTQAITPSQGTVSWSTLDSNVQGDLGVNNKNRIINGAMNIDQRNAGASSTTATTAAQVYSSLDRWAYVVSQASKFTMQQNAGSVTPPAGFTNYLGCTSTAATSVGSSDYFQFNQIIEGFNIADLNWGTANAKTITVSFWVRSSLTGTFGGALRNSALDRSYPFTYTISAANTWEQKSVTIAGDTSGTWVTNNGIGIRLNFSLGMGSTFSGTAGAWAGSNFASATGATSVVGTNGATFYLTGVQLEIGTQATTFTTAGGSYGAELALCQRYYERYALAANTIICPMQCYSTSAAFGGPIKYTVTKRATPTITLPTAGSGSGEAALSTSTGSFPGTIGTHSISGETVDMARVNATGYTGAFTAGNASMYLSTNSGTAVIQISAEL
jgi:hypothetical protein